MTEKKADLPAVNWLVHVLNQPVEPGLPRLDLDRPKGAGEDYWAEFDSEYTRSLFLELARLYKQNEQELHRLRQEQRATEWLPASDPPDNYPHSSIKCRRVLVTSPALQYVVPNGVTEGFFHDGWHVLINGTLVRHKVTHWRYLPPPPNPAPLYNEVKGEAERIRCAAGLPREAS